MDLGKLLTPVETFGLRKDQVFHLLDEHSRNVEERFEAEKTELQLKRAGWDHEFEKKMTRFSPTSSRRGKARSKHKIVNVPSVSREASRMVMSEQRIHQVRVGCCGPVSLMDQVV